MRLYQADWDRIAEASLTGDTVTVRDWVEQLELRNLQWNADNDDPYANGTGVRRK